MGLLYGWHVLEDTVTLTGVVGGFNGTPSSDGDWCILVAPDASCASLLRNPQAPHANANGFVECEIEPPDNLQGLSAEDSNVVLDFLNPMLHRHVTITGTWAVDLQHRWDGATSPCIFSACDDGKTEIHPITSILHERNRPDPYTRQFDFFVFSDDSMNFPTSVPHSKENRTASISVPVPEGTTFTFAREINMARSNDFQLVHSGSSWNFVGNVQSGTPDEGKGFFYGLIDLHLPQPPAPPPQPAMRLEVTHPTPLPWDEPVQLTVRAFDAKTGKEIDGAQVGIGMAAPWQPEGTTPSTFSYTFHSPGGREFMRALPSRPPNRRPPLPPLPPRRITISYYVVVTAAGYAPIRQVVAHKTVTLEL